MICPDCKKELEKAIFYGTEVDFCSKCVGIWFEEDELRMAKDNRDKNLNWVDIDLWKDQKKFRISRGNRLCPLCRLPLYEVNYDESKVKVDLCNLCKGVWLDSGEFRRIIKYLKEKADYEILHHFSKNLHDEFWEIFIGPEKLREEILDYLTVLKLLKYKFITQHPYLAKLISFLPK